jgi:Flp pilus assembly protein TadG
MNLLYRGKSRNNQKGQVLVTFVVIFPVLLLFMGLALDLGFAYVTKTALSKAADAAALSAMRNINQGQAKATAIAVSAFNVNYQAAIGTGAAQPVINVAINNNSSNNPVVTVGATTTISTFFLGLLPGFNTLNVSSSAQATRPKLIMSLVLDKSGSMNKNGGATALPPAVDNFMSYFDDSTDQVAMVSFSTVPTVNVSMRSNFSATIVSAINGLSFGGTTYAEGGLLNGQAQINSVVVPTGDNVVKVAVFFTDGWANTVQTSLACPTLTTLNVGGCAPPEAAVGWCNGIGFMDPNTGGGVGCGATSFLSLSTGTMQPLTPSAAGMLNTSNDAMYRAIQAANSMRAQNITVYSIGLGNKISQPFLQQIANDPASITFDSTQPQGQAVFAATAADLQEVFQTIASNILLRLSQ